MIAYMKACTFSMTGLVILFYILTNASSVGSNFWLAHWSNQESAAGSTSTDVYVLIILTCTCCIHDCVSPLLNSLLTQKHICLRLKMLLNCSSIMSQVAPKSKARLENPRGFFKLLRKILE